MNTETIFYNKVNERRVRINDIGQNGFKERAILYVNAACS